MKISDLLRLSFDNLKRRKGRTILTVLGVIIGTCSIIMMVSIGVALDKSFDEMMTGMGDLTMIEVYNWSGNSEVEPITDRVVDSFARLEGVRVATPLYRSQYISPQFTSGSNDKYRGWGNIRGIRREAMEIYGYELKEGRFPNDKDKEFTMIVGEYFAYNFENTRKQWPNSYVDPIPDENGVLPEPFIDIFKDEIYINAYTYTDGEEKVFSEEVNIVGVIKEDYSKGYETYSGAIMDMEDLIAMEKEYMEKNDIRDENKGKERTYDEVVVKVNDIEDVETIEQYIQELGYSTYSMTSQRNEMKRFAQMIQLILGGLGSIAMLVSAISIANTMTMAIYERTKEIGVMKVLGCQLKDIKNMFLAEAAGIGFLGGMIGLVICYGLSALINTIGASFMGGEQVALSIIPVWLAVFGVGFSTLVGIISGYVPALRAVKITALSAIRHD